jgi:AbrB family looped-hinge helix DNA binding protein
MARFSSPISSKGQITIPIDIRTRKGIKPADRFEIVEQGEGIYLRPVRFRVSDLAGIIPHPPGQEDVDLDEIIEEIRQERADEFMRRFNGE